MSFPDLSFIDTGRRVEVEAVEGGRAMNEFTVDPESGGNDEEVRVLGKAVDDMEETGERVQTLQEYVPHARSAFQQRGLTYPFDTSLGGDSLSVLPGHADTARLAAKLSAAVSQGKAIAKEFEMRAFRALQLFLGGWGVCVGAPRDDGQGPEAAIRRFRALLEAWEVGQDWPADFARSGDYGADGFVILGRGWGGPVVFFQSKNTSFSLKDFPEEFARMSEVFNDWFGRRVNRYRTVVPVCALNTVLTIEQKERIAEARGPLGGHIIDAADILGAELGSIEHPLRVGGCTVF